MLLRGGDLVAFEYDLIFSILFSEEKAIEWVKKPQPQS